MPKVINNLLAPMFTSSRPLLSSTIILNTGSDEGAPWSRGFQAIPYSGSIVSPAREYRPESPDLGYVGHFLEA